MTAAKTGKLGGRWHHTNRSDASERLYLIDDQGQVLLAGRVFWGMDPEDGWCWHWSLSGAPKLPKGHVRLGQSDSAKAACDAAARAYLERQEKGE